MSAKFLDNLSFVFLLASACFLPWQTKLIWLPAPSNYWEISFFAAFFCVLFFVVFFLPGKRLHSELVDFFRRNRLLSFAFLILIFSGFVSAVFSAFPALSLFRWFLLLLAISFFYCLLRSPLAWRHYFIVIVLSMLAVQAAMGLLQFFGQLTFASSWLGIASHRAGDLGAAVIETSDGRWLRAYGASDHPNIFGGLMALGALSSLYALFYAGRRRIKLILPAAYFLFFGALLASFSRAALAAFIFGLLILIFERRLFGRNYRRVLFAFLFFSLLVAALFGWQYRGLLRARTGLNNRLEVISLDERAEFNRRAWHNFADDPLGGVGLGASSFLDYRRGGALSGQAWRYQPAHNYWLLAAAEGGVIFMAAWFLIWLEAYKKSRKHLVFGLFAAIFFLSLFDHWLFSLPLSSFWLLSLFALML
jgi:O-antigen ligase